MSDFSDMCGHVLAVTGGIGAGKSYVCDIFSALHGIPVYDSDSRTKALYDTDAGLLEQIRVIAGDSVISSDGRLSKKRLASMIFSDPHMLSRVEAAVFPAVMKDFDGWKRSVREDASRSGRPAPPFVIIESAIFLSKPVLAPMADKVLYVDAPLELRIERVMRRDGVGRDEVLARISNQPPVDLSRAEWIIDTSCGREAVENVVAAIVKALSLCRSM